MFFFCTQIRKEMRPRRRMQKNHNLQKAISHSVMQTAAGRHLLHTTTRRSARKASAVCGHQSRHATRCRTNNTGNDPRQFGCCYKLSLAPTTRSCTAHRPVASRRVHGAPAAVCANLAPPMTNIRACAHAAKYRGQRYGEHHQTDDPR